jgi:hypothetical protein
MILAMVTFTSHKRSCASDRSSDRFARRMKRRFHRDDFVVVSVDSLHRYRQLHELTIVVTISGKTLMPVRTNLPKPAQWRSRR